ncbi:hypothetical protein PMS82_00615 [Bifidobacterium longum]|nr:hypothetical protein [Bifidobacterium longum]MDB6600499.1 hypothetical protein [Bifidobacterium longum]MDB6799133.1 hypothetical protein [Bifidobacterium longum]MDB6829269.1 hypothetical protein [Bifidobacterium longum]MDB6833128.1 hypothetical protein [Bifidobacterium longum]
MDPDLFFPATRRNMHG